MGPAWVRRLYVYRYGAVCMGGVKDTRCWRATVEWAKALGHWMINSAKGPARREVSQHVHDAQARRREAWRRPEPSWAVHHRASSASGLPTKLLTSRPAPPSPRAGTPTLRTAESRLPRFCRRWQTQKKSLRRMRPTLQVLLSAAARLAMPPPRSLPHPHLRRAAQHASLSLLLHAFPEEQFTLTRYI